MEVKSENGVITVESPDTFDIKQTLECGQVFRYRLTERGAVVFSGDKRAEMTFEGGKIKIFAKDEKYFLKYLDFATNYATIIEKVQDKGLVSAAAAYASGIRILKQDPYETAISFIISANNHIPRIKSIIERVCAALGEDMGGWHAFPEIGALASKDADFYFGLGAGYRAPYIAETARLLTKIDLEKVRKLTTDEASEVLKKLPGVGPKVADCILLFGLGKTDVFPVDTWIKKVYRDMYGEATSAVMRRELISRYGELSGYVQQYLFYYKREQNS
ncbi:MAG: DNA-3-methyladenine glycosylase 2 family protein [Clostridiaceae bacterium]|jgi:N-glycosylase/DNA lyase|nr:DNA-3-methyladenine glycosylase 2 family protein [Clostridiaceae bacterium]